MIIVTRHTALVALLRERNLVSDDCVVVTHVDDPAILDGQDVWGVLPLALAARCASITVVPLALSPEDRGKELGLDRLREIAGDPVTYRVVQQTSTSMSEMEVLERQHASNSPHAGSLVLRAPKGTNFPARGDWVDKTGDVLHTVWDFVPRPDGPLAIWARGKVKEAKKGAFVVVAEMHGHESLTAGYCQSETVCVVHTGYKNRTQRIVRWSEGVVETLTPETLVDTMDTQGESATVSLADKLREAGIIS